MSGWWAGSASRPFPVPIGTPMAGYMARIGPAEGVRDELTVGALVLDQNGNRLAIVAADVAAVDTELVEEISAAAGLRPDELGVCASRTHSGPAGVLPRLHPGDDDRLVPELRATFVATCAAALGGAVDRREPVELIVGRSTVAGLAANRNDPDGPYDPGVTVLATRTFGGQLRAILVHAACHPTILGANSRFISADFPGALRRNLAMRPGDGGRAPEVLYANGAAGDVSTRYSRRSQDGTEVERVGAGFAEAALEALRSA